MGSRRVQHFDTDEPHEYKGKDDNLQFPKMTLVCGQRINVPDLYPPLQYHVFICHCAADLLFAKDLLTDIERHEFKCVFAGRNFLPGELITENIITAINLSRKVLMVYSKQTIKSEWCTFEVIMTLEKSLERDRCLFVPVLLPDASIEDIPRTFSRITCIETKDDTDYLSKILYAISVPDPPMKSQLPAGNVGHALAWSYFYGYLNLVLPECCACYETLTDEDAAIEHAGCLNDVSITRAGTIARKYKNTVYKVTYKSEEYYCVCEYATAIVVMHEMEVNQLAGLSSHDRKLQVERFHKTIESILVNGSQECKGKARIIRYNQNGPKLSKILVKIIKEEIKRETFVEGCLNSSGCCTERTPPINNDSLPIVLFDTTHRVLMLNNIHVTSNGNFVEKILDTHIMTRTNGEISKGNIVSCIRPSFSEKRVQTSIYVPNDNKPAVKSVTCGSEDVKTITDYKISRFSSEKHPTS